MSAQQESAVHSEQSSSLGSILRGRPGETLVILAITYAVNSIDRRILGLLLEPIKQEFNLSDTQLGLLTGFTFAIFYATFGIFLARLSDTRSRKVLIAVCTLMFSLATIFCGLATGFLTLLLARMCVAIGEAGPTPASISIIAQLFPSHRRQAAIAVFVAALEIGGGLGIAAIALLGAESSWRTLFFLAGTPGIILAVLIFLRAREPARELPAKPEPVLSIVAVRNMFSILKIRSVWWLGVAGGLNQLVVSTVGSWNASFLARSYGLDRTHIILFLSGTMLVGGITNMTIFGGIYARLRKRGPRFPLIGAGFVMATCAIAYTVALSSSSLVITMSAIVVALVLDSMVQGPIFAMVQDLVGDRSRATAHAVLAFLITSIGMGIGPLAAGALSDSLQLVYQEESLRYALRIVVILGAMAGISSIIMAARGISRDLERYGGAGARAS